MTEVLKSKAKEWFKAVYLGNTVMIGELAADDIAISYPIFQQIFSTPAIRGRKAAVAFAERFVTKWAEGEVTYHEVIAEGNRVVLVWSFSARNIGELQKGKPPTNEVHSWGGISLIRFDDDGKVVEELGEESAPGPYGRMRDEGSTM